jgi:hypothetical protein
LRVAAATLSRGYASKELLAVASCRGKLLVVIDGLLEDPPRLQMLFGKEEVRKSTSIFSVRDPVDRNTP